MSYFLFLDDERDPYNMPGETEKKNYPAYVNKLLMQDLDFFHAKNFQQFKDIITEHGLPEFISFDHDLGDLDKTETQFTYMDEVKRENTGVTCAAWLIDYCMDNHIWLPKFAVHSANPSGGQNITQDLNRFARYQDEEGL